MLSPLSGRLLELSCWALAVFLALLDPFVMHSRMEQPWAIAWTPIVTQAGLDMDVCVCVPIA